MSIYLYQSVCVSEFEWPHATCMWAVKILITPQSTADPFGASSQKCYGLLDIVRAAAYCMHRA